MERLPSMSPSFHRYSSPSNAPVKQRAPHKMRAPRATATARLVQRSLGDTQRLNPIDGPLQLLSGVPQVDSALRIEPELRRIPKEPREANRHLGTHRPTLAEQLIHGLPRHPRGFGERGDREPVVRHKVLTQHLAGMNGSALHRLRIRNRHVRSYS